MTKTEELEKAVQMLEAQVATNKTMSEGYQQELVIAQKALTDVNKPVLTAAQLDLVWMAIESGVNSYDFSDSDNFDYEFDIDYDNRISLSNLDLSNSHDLVESIVAEVSKLFTKKLDTTEADA